MNFPRPCVRAFTLVELMAAMTVLSLLMVALVAMLDQAMRGWQSAQRGMDARREVRTALQLLESDLKGMVVGSGRPAFIEVEPPPKSSSRLTFLTLLRTNSQETNNPGDVAAVQYYIDTNAAGSFRLYRRLGSSRGVYNNLVTQPNITSPDILLGANPVTEELAGNVFYFRAELKRWSNNNLTGADLFNNSTNWQSRPELVQLELTAYSQQKAQAFRTVEDWRNTSNIQKFGKTYLWRVFP